MRLSKVTYYDQKYSKIVKYYYNSYKVSVFKGLYFLERKLENIEQPGKYYNTNRYVIILISSSTKLCFIIYP